MAPRGPIRTDRQLLQAYVQTQDVQAFGVFVGRHEGALLSFAAAFLRDEVCAQDVVQEAFLRAARHPQRLLDGAVHQGAERNWLLKVVRDLSVDFLRRRAAEQRKAQNLAAIAPREAPAAEAALEVQEDVARMRGAIERLRPHLRELVLLKVQEQKSYKEMAEITGLSVTNVGFLLHRAMTELAKELRA